MSQTDLIVIVLSMVFIFSDEILTYFLSVEDESFIRKSNEIPTKEIFSKTYGTGKRYRKSNTNNEARF